MTSYIIAITFTVLMFISPTVNAHNVRDVKGNQVINGANYYMRSTVTGPGPGSITWGYNASSIQNCPLFLSQLQFSLNTAASVTTYETSKYIPLGASVYITFPDNDSPCNNQLNWSAMQSDSIASVVYVVVGNQLPSFDNGVFRVVDAGINQKFFYKFMYCTDDFGCMDVGWLANSDYRDLAMTTDPTMELNPFYFVFVKA